MCLSVKGIQKTHKGDIQVARNISFQLEKGQLGALIGPSGCGKTTMLRMIAGFERPDNGLIEICGDQVFSLKINTAPEKRKVGMVFQDYALFPHLTVKENILFGPINTSEKDYNRLIALTGLEKKQKKYPHELSGGQQQRVALARALAPKPGVLLMDEPFSNLDVSLREVLSEEVRFILKEFGITGFLVTHNQHEAFAMADYIGVMMDGKLLQWNTAEYLYFSPACDEVARFVGEGSFITARPGTDGRIKTNAGIFSANSLLDKNIDPGKINRAFIRPESVVLDQTSSVKARLVKSHFRGPGRFHTFELVSGETLTCHDSCPASLNLNQEYGIRVSEQHVSFF